MHREVARRTADPRRQPEDLGPGAGKIRIPQLWQGLEFLQVAVFRCSGTPDPGQFFGDAADFAARNTENLGGFADCHARLQGHMVGHHGRVAAETGQHCGQDLVPLIPGEIDIDIRAGRCGRD